MLEKVDLTKRMDKNEFKVRMEELKPKLTMLQRDCRALNIPVMILFEGLGASGKGTLITHLIEPLDPRGFKVFTTGEETEEERMRPFLWRFWIRTPEKGQIAVFDRGWYRKVQVDRFEKKTTAVQLLYAYDEIINFEKMLTDDGMIIIKFYLYISKEEQKKRFKKLLDSPNTSWRVSEGDLDRNKHYHKYLDINEEMLEKTDSKHAPWNIIEATDKEYAISKMMQIVANTLSDAVAMYRNRTPEQTVTMDTLKREYISSVLARIDLNKVLPKQEYKERLKQLQSRLKKLHNAIYRKRIPVVIVFEGWDAGGKGGAIKRLTKGLDPRGYTVNPFSSPNDIQKQHHYLWRFWNTIPKAGHIAVYDRSWYGRVMVERIEGYCSETEWKRAYKEINQMEEHFAHYNTVVLKFWMQIDKEEQALRFKARQENPLKQWKITDEDWRNRSKWDEYEITIDEMLIKTSTTYAPWTIVEANDKHFARIKVLETVVQALEEALKEK